MDCMNSPQIVVVAWKHDNHIDASGRSDTRGSSAVARERAPPAAVYILFGHPTPRAARVHRAPSLQFLYPFRSEITQSLYSTSEDEISMRKKINIL